MAVAKGPATWTQLINKPAASSALAFYGWKTVDEQNDLIGFANLVGDVGDIATLEEAAKLLDALHIPVCDKTTATKNALRNQQVAVEDSHWSTARTSEKQSDTATKSPQRLTQGL